jgi:nucleotide-binding universal stress UspA family protein
MIRRILFPFDFSAQGVQVAPFVRALASQFHASVTLLSVVPINLAVLPIAMEEDVVDWTRALQSRLDHTLGAELGDVPVKRIAVAGDPSGRITELAHNENIDLIMMPTHGLGLFRSLLVGSTTSKVLHDARCPVWTAAHAERQRNGGVPRRMLCAVDGGPESGALLKWADDFSGRLGATLTVLHVVGPMPDWPSFEPEGALQEQMRQAAHEKILSLQSSAGVRVPLHVAVGEIPPTVAEEACQQAADLILIGRGLLQAPLGRLRTHAYGIIQRSPCAVLSI